MDRIPRRRALELLAAAPAVAIAGCEQRPHARTPRLAPATVGGDAIRSVEPLARPWQTEDPFLFCAYHLDDYPAGNAAMGPAAPLAGRRIGSDFADVDGWNMYHGDTIPGFPRHPHRGFETVTVVRRGVLDHSDSLGATARYGEGDVQWLTAGAGIQHAEMFPLVHTSAGNPLELFQIWLNLPSGRKMVEPHFSMLWAPSIATLHVADAEGRATSVTIVAGRLGDRTPPSAPPASYASESDAHVAIWTLSLDPRATFTLPAAPSGVSRALYYHRGRGLRAGGRAVPPMHRVTLHAGSDVALSAGEDRSELLLLQGRPIGEPIARHGPFVMNSDDEIRQAYAEYRRTGFGGWPWGADDPVHARPQGRFARRPDGSIETPPA